MRSNNKLNPPVRPSLGIWTQATAVWIECSHYYPIPAPPIIFPQHHPAKSLLLVLYKPYLWNFNSFLEWTFNFFQINLDELFAVWEKILSMQLIVRVEPWKLVGIFQFFLSLTLQLPWLTKTEFLLTKTMLCQAEKRWEERKISVGDY